ncbi:MAG: PAS domain S-box protein [Bacteroidales bacterium]|nr:PAS domain S-box protein [Bacteroidales bacterium]
MARLQSSGIQQEKLDRWVQVFSGMFDSTTQLFILMDVHGIILHVNPSVEKLLGKSQHELRDKEWFKEFLHPEDQQRESQKYIDLLAEKHNSVSIYCEREVGQEKPLDLLWNLSRLQAEYFGFGGIIAVGNVIALPPRTVNRRTSREEPCKQLSLEHTVARGHLSRSKKRIEELEQKLQEVEKKASETEILYKTLYYNSPVMLQSTDIQGNIVSVNRAWLDKMEYTLEEVIGTPVVNFLSENMRDIYPQLIQKLLEVGEINNIKAIAVTRTGKEINVQVSSRVLMDSQGSPLITMTMISDISEMKKSEERQKLLTKKLRESKNRAEESDRLKSAFLQNLSHEIRTPMNAICGFSQLIQNATHGNEKIAKYSHIIANSSNQLLSIVNNILTISSLETKQERVNLHRVNINAILREMYAMYTNHIAYRHTKIYLETPLPDDEMNLYTDETKFKQILTNLLNNALRFANGGRVDFGYEKKGDFFRLYVKDDGIGIPLDKQKLIFERFRQADDSIGELFGGTGLGLTISKAFVELLGGKIWLESTPGRGAQFYFTHPCSGKAD